MAFEYIGSSNPEFSQASGESHANKITPSDTHNRPVCGDLLEPLLCLTA